MATCGASTSAYPATVDSWFSIEATTRMYLQFECSS